MNCLKHCSLQFQSGYCLLVIILLVMICICARLIIILKQNLAITSNDSLLKLSTMRIGFCLQL